MNDSAFVSKCRAAVLALFVLGAGVLWASVIDLPVKKINGKEYYFHKVGKGETVYGLSQALGITQEQLVKYNPAVADGLKKGQKLYFPVGDFGTGYGTASVVTTDHIVKRGETLYSLGALYKVPVAAIVELNPGAENGIKAGQHLTIPGGTAVTAVDTDQLISTMPVAAPAVPAEVAAVGSHSISTVLFLPLELEEEKPSKEALYATDFYRGVLLGLDSLRYQYGNPAVSVSVLDCSDPQFRYNTQQVLGALRGADIIVAPDDAARFKQLAELGKRTGKFVLNPFLAKDSTYLDNEYVIQGYIPQAQMFGKAVDAMVERLDGRTLVLLDNGKGKRDKAAFVDELTGALGQQGATFRIVRYDGTLTSKALEDVLPTDGDYVFLPMSGSTAEFNKFITALVNFKAMVDGARAGGSVTLYGYPEWVRFTGKPREQLRAINTVIYSRFFARPEAEQELEQNYMREFHAPLPEGVPNMVLAGFDVANLILSMADDEAGLSRRQVTQGALTEGAQQSYMLLPQEGGGLVNTAMYMITFTPGGESVLTL